MTDLIRRDHADFSSYFCAIMAQPRPDPANDPCHLGAATIQGDLSDEDFCRIAGRSDFSAGRDGFKAEIAKIDEDIAALDRVLALDPSYQPANASKPRKRASSLGFSRGELSAGILEALRSASEPITVAECAEALAVRKGIPGDDLARFKVNVSAAMTYLAKRDRVRRIHNGEQTAPAPCCSRQEADFWRRSRTSQFCLCPSGKPLKLFE